MGATIGVFLATRPFLTIAMLVPLCAWVAIQRTTPRYTATGSLIYDPSDYKVRELQSILLASDPTTEAAMASQAEILQSLKVAQRVAERSGIFTPTRSSIRPSGRPALSAGR